MKMSEQQGVEVTIVVPVGLTAARIQRANPAINEETADALAIKLHEIIALARCFYSVHPDPDNAALSKEADLVLTLLNTAVDVWPGGSNAAANESIWIAERFMSVGADEVYERYLRLCCKITPSLRADLDGLDFDLD